MPSFNIVAPGDPVSLSAIEWNTVRKNALGENFQPVTQGTRENSRPSQERIHVKNIDAEVIRAGQIAHCVGLREPDPFTNNFLAETGLLSWPDSIGNTCVLAESLQPNQLGYAYLSGVVAVRVYRRTEIQFRWCDVLQASDSEWLPGGNPGEKLGFQQTPQGSHFILDSGDDWGNVWTAVPDSSFEYADCFVKLGSPRETELEVVVTEAGGIPADGSGEVEYYNNGLATGYKVTAKLDWMHAGKAIDEGAKAIVRWVTRFREWRFRAAECP